MSISPSFFSSRMSVVQLSENQVKQLLDWPLVCDAVEQAFRSVSDTRENHEQPTSKQPARSRTVTENGILFCMPGYIGNYQLLSSKQTKLFNSLGCKLVTAFPNNSSLQPPKPNILANIFLLNELTGELKAIIQGTEITAWRTAAASIVATKFLYSSRPPPSSQQIDSLAILGCGVQGRIHAIGFCAINSINTIRLWNRTIVRAGALAAELNQLRATFKNPHLKIVCANSAEECVESADVIVTSTFTSSPFLFRSMVKENVHINAVGAGINHFSELSKDLYTDPKTKIYVDSNANAESELNGLYAPIDGEIGDIINGHKAIPSGGITIFHSMGMAVEDVSVAEAVLDKYKHQNE